MSIGKSGRVVIEIEPDLKQQLHAALRLEGKSLKSWFLEHAEELLENHKQQQILPFEKSTNNDKRASHEIQS